MPLNQMIEGEMHPQLSTPELVTAPNVERFSTFDYTVDLFGDRTNSVLARNPDFARKISSFTSEREINGSDSPVVVAIPGLVVSSSTTFEGQIEFLRSFDVDVIGMDYSNEGFSRELANAQILDMLHSDALKDRDISLLGLSLGSGLIIDALLNAENGSLGNLGNVILLGAVYSDDDINKSAFAKTFSFANRHTPDIIANRFAPLAKRLFSLDPHYPVFTRDEVLKVSNEALIERLKTLGQVNPINLTDVININASIGWWNDDYSSQDARRRIERVFTNSTVFNIPGDHAWTRSGSEVINDELANSLGLN